MKYSYAKMVIDDIYEEGDIDITFVEQLIGIICFDDADKKRDLSQNQVLERLVMLIEFFTKNGDFSLYEGIKDEFGKSLPSLIETEIKSVFEKYNLPDDLDFRYFIKKTKKGKTAGQIPQEIVRIIS